MSDAKEQIIAIADDVLNTAIGGLLRGSSQFRVVFLKQIHSCFADTAAGDAWMHRELSLPFVPPRGTLFTLPDGWVARAVDVQWDGRMFVVYTEADDELYQRQANNKPGRDIALIVAEWENEKWELLGYGAFPPIKTEEADGEG